MNAASFIEHHLLKPGSTVAEIEQLCTAAVHAGFAAVCVPAMYVKKAKELTSGTHTKVATVIGFPMGYNAIESKLAETVLAIVDGADELDLMINLVALKNGDWQYLAKEINTIMQVVRKSGRLIKVIIEAGVLSADEVRTCCDIYGAAGVDFIQTSTGYAEPLASIGTLSLIRNHLANAINIKYILGKLNPVMLKQAIEAGASRVVCDNPLQAVEEFLPVGDGMIFEIDTINKI